MESDKQKLIFVLDDDETILDALGLLLQDEGYEVLLSTKNGEYIENQIRERAPDLIILDILLSGHDGRLICSYLKSEEYSRNIPIVLISAHPGARASALASGADDFLEKPFDIDELLSVVERLIAVRTN